MFQHQIPLIKKKIPFKKSLFLFLYHHERYMTSQFCILMKLAEYFWYVSSCLVWLFKKYSYCLYFQCWGIRPWCLVEDIRIVLIDLNVFSPLQNCKILILQLNYTVLLYLQKTFWWNNAEISKIFWQLSSNELFAYFFSHQF